jgi:hypothetical protein
MPIADVVLHGPRLSSPLLLSFSFALRFLRRFDIFDILRVYFPLWLYTPDCLISTAGVSN